MATASVTLRLRHHPRRVPFGGFVVSFLAARQGFIGPESFTFVAGAPILPLIPRGGMGRRIGGAAAAAVMIGGFGLFRDLKQFRMLVFGLAMIAIMVWRPRGPGSSRGSAVALGARRMSSVEDVAEARG